MFMMKTIMRKLPSFIAVVISGIFYLSLAAVSSAQTICPTGSFANLCNIKIQSGSKLFANILTAMLVFGVVLSLFFLLWGGIRWIMSGGDKAKLDAARGTVSAAIVGLLIAFLSFAIVSIITVIFTGQPITNLSIQPIVP